MCYYQTAVGPFEDCLNCRQMPHSRPHSFPGWPPFNDLSTWGHLDPTQNNWWAIQELPKELTMQKFGLNQSLTSFPAWRIYVVKFVGWKLFASFVFFFIIILWMSAGSLVKISCVLLILVICFLSLVFFFSLIRDLSSCVDIFKDLLWICQFSLLSVSYNVESYYYHYFSLLLVTKG